MELEELTKKLIEVFRPHLPQYRQALQLFDQYKQVGLPQFLKNVQIFMENLMV